MFSYVFRLFTVRYLMVQGQTQELFQKNLMKIKIIGVLRGAWTRVIVSLKKINIWNEIKFLNNKKMDLDLENKINGLIKFIYDFFTFFCRGLSGMQVVHLLYHCPVNTGTVIVNLSPACFRCVQLQSFSPLLWKVGGYLQTHYHPKTNWMPWNSQYSSKWH